MATIADELSAMVERYPDRTFVNARLCLTGDEWAEFIAFMGERDDWLIFMSHTVGDHKTQCRRVVENTDKTGRLASGNFTAESFTLAKMFVAGFPPLEFRDSERITLTSKFHIAEEGYPVFERFENDD